MIVYGVLTDLPGRPTAIAVYPGNTGDPATVADQVNQVKHRCGLQRVILVGDRGLLTPTQLESLKPHPGIGWISALRTEKVRQRLDQAGLPRSPEPPSLAAISCPEFPQERLIVCFNPLLAPARRRKRQDLLQATEQVLEKLVRAGPRRTQTALKAAAIGTRVGKLINRFHVGKHFETVIADGHFSQARRTETIDREAELEGLYVLRTSESQPPLSAADTVRRYKTRAQVERVVRTLKGREIQIRPSQHRPEARVRAHRFLCLLVYYVEWHLRQAWAPLLFDDHALPVARQQRDPVAPAQPSAAAPPKKGARVTAAGWPVHSFTTLMTELGTRCRQRWRLQRAPQRLGFVQDTHPTPLQAQALELIRLLPVPGP